MLLFAWLLVLFVSLLLLLPTSTAVPPATKVANTVLLKITTTTTTTNNNNKQQSQHASNFKCFLWKNPPAFIRFASSVDVVKAAAEAVAANNNYNNHSKNEKTSTAVIENHSLYASHDADPQTALREMVVGNPLHVGWWDDNN